ncbi:MAG: hypothetical protein AAF492_05670, partial [Verrucomicrobiota bacterium]
MSIKHHLILLLFGGPWLLRAEDADRFVTRILPVSPPLIESSMSRTEFDADADFFDIDDQPTEPDNPTQELFSHMGVPFPQGATVRYNPTTSSLIIRNTPENVRIFERIMSKVNVVPSQVEIDIVYISFSKEELGAIVRKSEAASLDADTIRKLWKSGRGRLEAGGSLVTRTGLNAIIEAVEEVIYPSEFEVEKNPRVIRALPGSYETREIGLIQNVTPTVGPDGYTLELTLSPELCRKVSWVDYGFEYTDKLGRNRRVRIEQPVFYSRNMTSSIVLYDGQTIVFGSTDHDGSNRVTFSLISATMLDPTGSKVHTHETVMSPEITIDEMVGNVAWNKTIYPVSPSAIEKAVNRYEFEEDAYDDEFVAIGGRDTTIYSTTDDSIKKVFVEHLGVPFPEGASISYNAAIASLIVRNTQENQELFKKVLDLVNLQPLQIEINGSFIAFKKSDLERWARESPTGTLETQSLKKRWQEGHGAWLGYSKIVTRTGLNAIQESVKEIIYPSEYSWSEADGGPATWTPGSFETREVG